MKPNLHPPPIYSIEFHRKRSWNAEIAKDCNIALYMVFLTDYYFYFYSISFINLSWEFQLYMNTGGKVVVDMMTSLHNYNTKHVVHIDIYLLLQWILFPISIITIFIFIIWHILPKSSGIFRILTVIRWAAAGAGASASTALFACFAAGEF